jgi:hypothetical protein
MTYLQIWLTVVIAVALGCIFRGHPWILLSDASIYSGIALLTHWLSNRP